MSRNILAFIVRDEDGKPLYHGCWNCYERLNPGHEGHIDGAFYCKDCLADKRAIRGFKRAIDEAASHRREHEKALAARCSRARGRDG